MTGRTPKLNALVVCDYAMQEAGSGKWSLMGVFSQIMSHQFPTTHPQMCIYVNFIDAQGQYILRLELVDVEHEEIIGRLEGEGNILDVLVPTELVFTLQQVQFPHPGKYEFRFFANDRIVGQKTFIVSQAPPPEPPAITETMEP